MSAWMDRKSSSETYTRLESTGTTSRSLRFFDVSGKKGENFDLKRGSRKNGFGGKQAEISVKMRQKLADHTNRKRMDFMI